MPEVRDRLYELAEQINVPELRTLADNLRRRPAVKRARVTSTPMAPELAEAVRAYAAAFPDASNQAIAQVFAVNPGRVSEALAGKRP